MSLTSGGMAVPPRTVTQRLGENDWSIVDFRRHILTNHTNHLEHMLIC